MTHPARAVVGGCVWGGFGVDCWRVWCHCRSMQARGCSARDRERELLAGGSSCLSSAAQPRKVREASNLMDGPASPIGFAAWGVQPWSSPGKLGSGL